MFTDDPPELTDIENRLRDAVRLGLKPEDDQLEYVLLAHMHMLSYHLAFFCPGCRKAAWKELKRMFPCIIRHANALASEIGADDPQYHHHHTQH